ncbi:hypothetical protein CgunFtcFv8_005959 [Champsocephalus gunnari]|uniref:Uncharacterized protein n=1 Tax=Champsocephalus gunnari TaxID=52237 RepID=A0AAN8GYU1_CHAGU|nr:hypothetical protein CgunFtcFv8_005959 [Champsocephalus gunnari]
MRNEDVTNIKRRSLGRGSVVLWFCGEELCDRSPEGRSCSETQRVVGLPRCSSPLPLSRALEHREHALKETRLFALMNDFTDCPTVTLSVLPVQDSGLTTQDSGLRMLTPDGWRRTKLKTSL